MSTIAHSTVPLTKEPLRLRMSGTRREKLREAWKSFARLRTEKKAERESPPAELGGLDKVEVFWEAEK